MTDRASSEPITASTLRAAALSDLGASTRTKLMFILKTVTHKKLLHHFATAPSNSSLAAYLRERPELCGALVWPYQCASWSAAERLNRIAKHFELLDRAPPHYRFSVNSKLVLADLSDYSAGAKLILDQPKWLMREGLLSLNIFVEDFRAYSLAFSLNESDVADTNSTHARPASTTGIFIGGIQGRRTDFALTLYKELTHNCSGMRPRDLLIDLAKIVAARLGATRISAVAEKYRYFRHSYFGRDQDEHMRTNYDEIWAERGGQLIDDTHFNLPLATSIRALDEVPSKKRSLYRRRNDMLSALEAQIRSEAAPHFISFNAT